MCGVFGFVGQQDSRLLGRMGSVLSHRGPDDDGFLELPWVSLGHRRLSIIDVAGGHQPMSNEDGLVWLTFNGEIYNYRELRAELAARGHKFTTDSDTEVVVHAYEESGLDCLKRFNGMWALALVDLRSQKVFLARDHFGIKPLYYARAEGRLLFASEIKALLEDASLDACPNDQMVYDYLMFGLHDHKQETFFQGVNRVMPATYLEIDASSGVPGETTTHIYWEPVLDESADADPSEFLRLFRRAVERRLVSEVPVGSCLSGGLDSTSIVCLMRDLLKDKVPDSGSLGGRLKTFSAVFDKDPIDESRYISAAVAATQADPTYVRPQSSDFSREMLDLVWHQEEPFVSTGPYAQWCVMREAKRQVTVLLDGQGGDELLAGYVPYHFVYIRQLLKQRKIRKVLGESWAARDVMLPFLARRLKQRRKRLRIEDLLRPGFAEAATRPAQGPSQDNLKLRLLQDLTTFSLPALLRYEDKNSMAFSVESRIPYLDQELVEWFLRLPCDARIRDGWSRSILRRGLAGVIPEEVRKRRWKVGFTTPEMRWIKALRASFVSLFQSPAFQSRSYWDGSKVVESFIAACAGRVEESPFFWRAANVELWLRAFVDARGRPKSDFTELGDRVAASWQHTRDLADLVESCRPNPGKHLLATARGVIYARIPVRTDVVRSGDPLVDLLAERVSRLVREGDILAVAEKPLAVSQGRSYPVDQIKPSKLAILLSCGVTKSPHGIGLGMPETMQLAIDEAGAWKIILAAIVAAAAKPLGFHGVFYKIVGQAIASIDGPTPNTLPPYNREASLGPKNPSLFARRLASAFGPGVGVAVVDANDLGAKVVGCSPGVDTELVEMLMRDNPLGQGHEQTPVCILRRVGSLTPDLTSAGALPEVSPAAEGRGRTS